MQESKNVLVTGAAGFVGFHLVKALINKGFNVVGLDNLNDYYDPQLKYDRLIELGLEFSEIDELSELKTTNFTFIKGDLHKDATWEYIKTNYELEGVINLAAQAGVRYSLENAQSYISSNIMGFLKVLEFCREENIKELIYASSSSVYGMDSAQPFNETESCNQPVSIYAASKRTNELMAHTYCHLFGINSLGLRFFTVYGPWGRPDMAPFIFTKAAFSGDPIKVFNNGEQSRDFTYVDDIVKGVIQVYEKRKSITGAEVANIGRGAPVSLMDFIRTIEIKTGTELTKDFKEAQPGDVATTFADTSKLEAQFGYKPSTSLNDGIEEFVNWYKNYYKVGTEVLD
jgi:UDP-glucuronate 4-epimerase